MVRSGSANLKCPSVHYALLINILPRPLAGTMKLMVCAVSMTSAHCYRTVTCPPHTLSLQRRLTRALAEQVARRCDAHRFIFWRSMFSVSTIRRPEDRGLGESGALIMGRARGMGIPILQFFFGSGVPCGTGEGLGSFESGALRSYEAAGGYLR